MDKLEFEERLIKNIGKTCSKQAEKKGLRFMYVCTTASEKYPLMVV